MQIKELKHRLKSVLNLVINYFLKYRLQFVLCIVIFLGIFLRGVHLGTRELNPDESWVAYSVKQATYRGMLDTIIVSPFLFNTILFFVSKVLPHGEIGLRALPFLFGIGSIFLTYMLSMKVTKSKVTSLIAMAFLAFNPWHIFYSRFVKQYTTEVFYLLAILLLSEYIITKKYPQSWIYILFSIIAITGPLMSFPFVVVLVVLYPLFLYTFLMKKHIKKLVYITIPYTISAILFILVYILVIKEQTENEAVVDYWIMHEGFPIVSSMKSFVSWISERINGIVTEYPFLDQASFIWILLSLGSIPLILKKRVRILYYLIGILFILFIMSFFHKYPFYGSRLTLFITPLLYIITARGIVYLFQVADKKLYIPIALLISYLFTPIVYTTYTHVKTTRSMGIRESIHFINQYAQENETVINYNIKDTLWSFYTHELSTELVIHNEPTKKNLGSLPKTIKLLEDSNNNVYIVMKKPWPNLMDRYLKRKGNLLMYLNRDTEILGLYEEQAVAVYYVKLKE